MIIIYYQENIVKKITGFADADLLCNSSKSIVCTILTLAKNHPHENMVWCNDKFRNHLNLSAIESLLPNKKSILSFGNPSFLLNKIGYIEESPFIKINKTVRFPTWLMSADAGIISCEALNFFQNSVFQNDNFEYFLNSVAKIGMSQGMQCYSEPKIFLTVFDFTNLKQNANYGLFKFIKQHYKSRWLLLMFLNLMINELQCPLIPILCSIFYRKRNNVTIDFSNNLVENDDNTVTDYDVLIPTIGRKKYLYDFLSDLNMQTILPKNVIIIEQNPLQNASSELNYINDEKWNFNIKHIFTNQTGACNARNIGIEKAESFWTFLADDDISINAEFSENVFKKLALTNTNVATTNCHLLNEKQNFFKIIQWQTFGSGCSFVKTTELKKCQFLKSFEFGFGEDADFGMQLRNLGNDVLYFPSPKILHHKAPFGGFRTKPDLDWASATVQPKPSPTVMLYQILHNTKEQILGYKTILFLKFYRNQKIKNPVKYYFNFQKQWNASVHWANILKDRKW